MSDVRTAVVGAGPAGLAAALTLALAADRGVRFAAPAAPCRLAGDLLYAGHQNVNTALHMGNLAATAMVLDLAKRGFARAT
jgi:2-polyprenyl-6-methoxyphenol hydroxylase-like FAD-dependent oxidoreductase